MQRLQWIKLLCLVWWLYRVFTALFYCTMIPNIECEMSPKLTTPFPVNCEHFLVMMDVFIVWQMTLTTDGDYTSTLLFFFPFLCSPLEDQHSRAINRNTEWASERACHVKHRTRASKTCVLTLNKAPLFISMLCNHGNYMTKRLLCWLK